MIKILKNFIQGVAFGITGIIPAVSGGTIAIILGFYGEMVTAVNHFSQNRRVHIKFLLALLSGVITGLVLFSSVIDYMLRNFSFPTMAFFIGLVIGIIPSMYTKVKTPGRRFSPKEIFLVLIPILSLLVLSKLKPTSAISPEEAINSINTAYMLFLLLVGAITGAALVIPGISGSYLHLLLGVYPLITFSLASVRFLPTDTSLLPNITKVLAPLAVGIVIGGLFTAKLIEKLLLKHYKTTCLIVLGLLLGSVYTLFREPIVFQSGLSALTVAIGIITLSIGTVISLIIGKESKGVIL